MTLHGLDRSWYVIIEGAIGVGKTTLARMIRERLNTGLLVEVFEENPFLADFYREREQYAFQTQMFFLLSRYRQQQRVPHLLGQGALISDYMFAKDRLFAKLNLRNDEWDVYQQLHSALAEQIPTADLIVYLQADTDVLLARIAQRDRPYERDMDPDYIENVRQAYDRFFQGQQQVPALTINTNEMNFVTQPSDFSIILDNINSVLQEGTYQQHLPQFEIPLLSDTIAGQSRHLADYQRFHIELDKTKGFNTDIYFNYLCLSEEMGELGSELAKLWKLQDALVVQGKSATAARQLALTDRKSNIESELADCMAYLLKLANCTGINLESAYLEKMNKNQTRKWN